MIGAASVFDRRTLNFNCNEVVITAWQFAHEASGPEAAAAWQFPVYQCHHPCRGTNPLHDHSVVHHFCPDPMGSYRELILKYRLFMKAYPFSRYAIDPVPCTALQKPLAQSRVALVTTAGLHTPQQTGFDHSIKGGDSSFREIPNDAITRSLIESHKSDAFDHAGVEADRNLVFPLDRFRELVEQKVIGELNHRHFSFMGSITTPGTLIQQTAPQVARFLREDQVDVVFLTPV